ncbi:MAG TPA: ABC transporter permease [Anaerolineales bacterium]|jgi:lipopolysaccharide transport system permease protein
MSSTRAEAAPLTIIQPSRGWSWAHLAELWRYRELLFFLIWRDVKVRYKQTLLGAAWAILKPFFTMVVFTIIFGRLAEIPTDDAPAPVFYFAGLLPWILFQDGITKASNSLVTNRNLVTKVYFPRLAIPLSSVVAGLVDLGLAFLVLLGMMAFFGVGLSSAVIALPGFLLLALLTAAGGGLWLAALNVAYRDVGYVTPFVVQAWMYASPVAYSATLIPAGLAEYAYWLNPMAGVVQGFRWAILGTGQPSLGLLAISTASALVLLASGLVYFRRMERTFADVV